MNEQQLYLTTMNCIADAVIATDSEGRITFMNPVAQRLTGWTQDDAVGRDSKEIFCIANEETRREIESPIDRVIRDDVVVGLANHAVLLSKDGRQIPIDDSAAPIRNDPGELLGVVLVFRDVTESRHVAERLNVSEIRYRRLFEAARDGILILDGDTSRIIDSNPFMTELLGYSHDDFIGKELPDIGLFQDRQASMKAMRELQSKGFIRYDDLPLETHRGERREVEFVSNYYKENGHVVIQCNIRDITETKRADALARQQREITLLNERLQRAMTETHHRVKNNLQIIGAIVDARLMDGNETIPVRELRRISGAVRALAAVHDLLMQRAKDHGDADFLSTKEVIEQLLALTRQASDQVGIEAEIDDGRLSTRQCTSLAIILNELLSNAIKHGAGIVNVRYSISKAGGQLTVYDNGPGFPPDFEPTNTANTGLELVMMLSRWDLGGSVKFGNRMEGGARVVVTVP